MSLATLIGEPQTGLAWGTFAFEHAMAHRSLMGIMGVEGEFVREVVGPPIVPGHFLPNIGGLQGFTTMPYFIDPQSNDGLWHLFHNQAHQDAMSVLPNSFGFTAIGNIAPNHDFVDYNLDKEGKATYWVWRNHQQHLDANSASPLESIFPFW